MRPRGAAKAAARRPRRLTSALEAATTGVEARRRATAVSGGGGGALSERDQGGTDTSMDEAWCLFCWHACVFSPGAAAGAAVRAAACLETLGARAARLRACIVRGCDLELSDQAALQRVQGGSVVPGEVEEYRIEYEWQPTQASGDAAVQRRSSRRRAERRVCTAGTQRPCNMRAQPMLTSLFTDALCFVTFNSVAEQWVGQRDTYTPRASQVAVGTHYGYRYEIGSRRCRAKGFSFGEHTRGCVEGGGGASQPAAAAAAAWPIERSPASRLNPCFTSSEARRAAEEQYSTARGLAHRRRA